MTIQCRAFVVRTKDWKHGREVHIFEDDTEVGCTQTQDHWSDGAVISAACEWIELKYGLTNDEYYVNITGNYEMP